VFLWLAKVQLHVTYSTKGKLITFPCLSIRNSAAENCDYPIDIVLQSNDGRRFGAHTTQLSLYTESFPRSDQGSITSTPGETVVLTESPEVLLLMLQFMHNQIHPELENLDLDLLLAFAIAADKYGMYPALQTCRKAIKSVFQSIHSLI